MKIAFLTEMGFEGKITANHPNMRTEFEKSQFSHIYSKYYEKAAKSVYKMPTL